MYGNYYIVDQHLKPGDQPPTEMVECATGHLRDDHFQKLEEMIAVSRQYLERKNSRMVCRKAELDYHDIIASACPNLFLSFLCTFINYILYHFLHIERMESSLGREFAEQNLDFHIKIRDALRKEDKEKAAALMTAHMASAFQYIGSLKAIIDNSLISRQDL